MSIQSLNDWQTESLRLSAFTLEPLAQTASFWEQLVGTPPEAVNHRPRERSMQEEGPHLTGRLSVQANPNRIDWRLSQDPSNPANEFPVAGGYEDLQKDFRELMHQWIVRSCPPTQRLAFGAVLLFPVQDPAEGNKILTELLPALKIDMDMHDLLYRVNRRRHSRTIEGVELNRLSTWSIASILEIRVEVQGSERVESTVTGNVCRLELDVNTAPQPTQRIDDLAGIFEELVDLGNEIAAKGDVA